MKDLKILNEGRKDLLDLMNENEMNFILGGTGQEPVFCKRGYTPISCKCGYQGPILIGAPNVEIPQK